MALVVYDGYRPWYVTKMFYDATPDDLRHFVANPANGSRHNRGCAVDIGLYYLSSGEIAASVSGYDEFTPRAYSDYPGGSSVARYHRELLRDVMEEAVSLFMKRNGGISILKGGISTQLLTRNLKT